MPVEVADISSPFKSPTFGKDGSFEVNKPVGSMSISPCGRDVVLASRHGLHIVDLDSPWSPPRQLAHHTPWEVADVQWSPFPSRDHWVVSTSNQKALVWNLEMSSGYNPIELIIHGHTRALTDIQFSAHDPDMLATCAVDSFVHCWDLRQPTRPAFSFCDWFAGATQTKWNRRNPHIIASSHDRTLHIWDDRKGATPLRSLDAHDTKIYGIDWSRTDQNKIITCSLDKTIKFWDYSVEGNRPERLLRTPFPVWRARHTPFGYGIMAMPQRGDYDVYLYDCREESIWDRDPDRAPALVDKFTGHQNNVKEFLWRPRGESDHLADNREFQLVTWGQDHYLRLHHLDDNMLNKTGFERGKPGHQTTRRGAKYRTFRVEDAELPSIPPQLGPIVAASSFLGQGGSMTPGPSAGPLGWADTGFLNARHGTRTAASQRKDLDPITWMKGVKIGKKDDKGKQDSASMSLPTLNIDNWDQFDDLGEEVSHVGQTFSKVEFNNVDINKRFIRMSLSGPWGKERSQAFLTCLVEYPIDYPSVAAAVSLQETTSIVPERVAEMVGVTRTITHAFAEQKKHSTEAVIHYLQGDRTLDDLIGLLKQGLETPDILPVTHDGESSSEDEDELDPLSSAQLDELGLGGSEVLASSNANANVPLPKACGAIWTNDGRLLCFFPPKPDKLGSTTASYGPDGPPGSVRKKSRFFDGFGRLHTMAQARQSRASSIGTLESSPVSSDSEEDSPLTSSTDSSVVDGPLSDRPQTATQHMMYTSLLAQSMSLKPVDITLGSQASRKLDASFLSVPKNVISIHNYKHLLPSSEDLVGYRYDGPDMGIVNAELTSKLGLSELANAWHMVSNLLASHSPGLPMPPKRARRDSTAKHRVRNNNRALSFKAIFHTVPIFAMLSTTFLDGVGTNAAKDLFDYFVERGDVQMAAALACALRPILAPQSVNSSASGLQSALTSPIKNEINRPSIARQDSQVVEDSDFELMEKTFKHSFESSPSDDFIVNPPSLASSLGADRIDSHSSFSTGNTPPTRRIPKAVAIRDHGAARQLKPSPSRLWQFDNASGLIARAGNFASEFSRLSLSASASPPSRKFPSPSISFNISRSKGDGKSNTATRDSEKVSRRLSMPEDVIDEGLGKGGEDNKVKVQRPFRVRYRNKEETSDHQTVLSAPERERLRWLLPLYREAYAEMLSMWRLPVLRAEVLKHNVSPSPKPSSRTARDRDSGTVINEKAPFELGRQSRSSGEESRNTKTGVRIRRLCRNCGVPHWTSDKETISAPYKCTSCQVRVYPLSCILCNRMLRGKAFPCPSCGHVLHPRCRARVAADPHLQGQCPGGCSCHCMSRVVIDVKPAKKPPAARSIMRRDSAETLRTEVLISAPSPTLPSGAHGQHERHSSMMEGEIMDARSAFLWARDSLAKNLELRRRSRSVDRRTEREPETNPIRRRMGMKNISEWG